MPLPLFFAPSQRFFPPGQGHGGPNRGESNINHLRTASAEAACISTSDRGMINFAIPDRA